MTTKLTPFVAGSTKALKTTPIGRERASHRASAARPAESARLCPQLHTADRSYSRLRHAEGKTFSCNAFVPLTFGLGEAFQFDWGESP